MNLLLVSRIRRGHYYFIKDYPNYEENEFNEDLEDEDDDPYVTIGFAVLKLKWCIQEGSKYKFKYVKVRSLGDRALFVGDNSSVSLPASSFNGCKWRRVRHGCI